MVQAHFKITGKVQGVFYRAHAKEKAQQLGLKGIIKNMPDGSVEVILQGSAESLLDEFKKWAKKGSPGANPETVEMTFQKPDPQSVDVQIL